ncbi:MAG: DUF1573 domain-containing protein [Planctomycetaceae bacterium]
MFKHFQLAFSFGLMALSLMIGTASAEEAGKSWAIKMFAQPKFDFGPVAQHSDCQGYLEFTNCFEPVMEITSVSTSCRCISASTETKQLKPHETGRIKLVLDTSRFQGQRNVTLTVQFKYGESNYVTASIPCAAYIRTDVWMQPSFANLGSISAGVGGVQKVKVSRTGNDLWQIREVRSRNAGLKADFKELSRGNGRVDYEVTVKVSPEAKIGNIQDSLVLVTNDSSNANVSLRVEGRVEADIQVTPDVLALGKLTPGKESKVTLIVKSKKPVRLEGIAFSEHPDAFKVELPTDEKLIHVLSIVVTPPDAMGEFHETFNLTVAGRPQPVKFEAKGKVESLTTVQDSTN